MIMTASLGMAMYPDDAQDSVRLLRVADQRMYALKQRPTSSRVEGCGWANGDGGGYTDSRDRERSG